MPQRKFHKSNGSIIICKYNLVANNVTTCLFSGTQTSIANKEMEIMFSNLHFMPEVIQPA